MPPPGSHESAFESRKEAGLEKQAAGTETRAGERCINRRCCAGLEALRGGRGVRPALPAPARGVFWLTGRRDAAWLYRG